MGDHHRRDNIIRGPFPPPDPPAGVRFGVGLRYDVEHRDDGPWLVVYVGDKRIGEVPIKPGTEPRIRRAKVLDFSPREPNDDARDDAGGDRDKSSRAGDPDGD